MTVADLEKMSEEMKITDYCPPKDVHEKEMRRRKRISACICMLRKIVPGITDATENAEVFEISAKYLAYLKAKVGTQYDAAFLLEQMQF